MAFSHFVLITLALVSLSFAARTTTAKCDTNRDYDKCDSVCCDAITGASSIRSGGFLKESEVTGCCTDSATACPTGLTCCSAPTATQLNNNQRSCYDANSMGCCSIDVWDNPTNNANTKKAVTTFNSATHKCCTGAKTYAGTGQFSGVVAKDQSCVSRSGTRADCLSDSDCTGISGDSDASNYKCCRRPKQTETDRTETDGQYRNNARGVCIDTRTEGCCGGDTGYQWENDLTHKVFANARPFLKETEFCCPTSPKQVLNRWTERCPCKVSSDCGGLDSSSSCCFNTDPGSSSTVIALLECKSECTKSGGSNPRGCYGQCTRPAHTKHNPYAETCWTGCAGASNAGSMLVDGIQTAEHAGCCKGKDSMMAPQVYDQRSSVCCKAGRWSSFSGSYTHSSMIASQSNKNLGSGQRCACYENGDCPSGQSCCGGQGNGAFPKETPMGRCIQDKKEMCCERTKADGSKMIEMYNPDNQVCCPLDGVVTATVNSGLGMAWGRAYAHCSCSADSDCPTDGACCKDAQCENQRTWLTNANTCSIDDRSGCSGRCAYSKIETCCDDPMKEEGPTGVVRCHNDYQKCCEGTCCNKRTQKCKKGSVPHGSNWEGYRLVNDHERQRCTVLEAGTPWIAFYAFAFPALLLITFLILTILGILMFMKSDISGTVMKLPVIVMGVITFILCALMLFSPIWKYAAMVLIANTTCMFVARKGAKNGMMLLWISLFFLIDPLETNILHGSIGHISSQTGQTKSPGSQWSSADPGAYGTYGVLSAAMTLHDRSKGSYAKFEACTDHYKFFMYDNHLRDARDAGGKGDATISTFGLCAPPWMTTVGVVAGLLIPFQAFFVICFSALVMRPNTAGTKDDGTVKPDAAPGDEGKVKVASSEVAGRGVEVWIKGRS